MQVGTATVMGQKRNDVGILVWNCLEYVHLEDGGIGCYAQAHKDALLRGEWSRLWYCLMGVESV